MKRRSPVNSPRYVDSSTFFSTHSENRLCFFGVIPPHPYSPPPTWGQTHPRRTPAEGTRGCRQLLWGHVWLLAEDYRSASKWQEQKQKCLGCLPRGVGGEATTGRCCAGDTENSLRCWRKVPLGGATAVGLCPARPWGAQNLEGEPLLPQPPTSTPDSRTESSYLITGNLYLLSTPSSPFPDLPPLVTTDLIPFL